jgi:hypothetical protein
VSGPRDDASTPAPTSANASNSDTGEDSIGEGESTVDPAAGSSSEDGGLKLDVGARETEGDDPDAIEGCHKVDFLFVIDNSGSMSDEQANLVANFPGFIDTISAELDDANDYHIMVIDSDAYPWGGCETLCENPLFALPCVASGYECGVTVAEECEDILGAGVVHPKGVDSSNTACNFSSGMRYMDQTEPDLHAAFACAAQVGTGSMNDPERPMEAMVQAVTPSTEAWACNEGFLRDDAILVVTFITDEDDNPGDGSEGNVEGWRNALISAKHGDEKAVVVLGLFGDGDPMGGTCSGAEASPRLRQFVDSWGDLGFSGSVCAASYQPFFAEAVGLISTACEDFVPPG